ncbi:MAG: flagellar biosynthetic protein FliO [Verrucomicrobiota bacterium]
MKRLCSILPALFLATISVAAATAGENSTGLPNAGASVLRVFGALIFVLALFLGGVWLFRNWQRLSWKQNQAPRLQIVEMKPLGNRQALYVVAYEQQRLLVATSQTGIALLTHLPDGENVIHENKSAVTNAPISFAQALQQVLARKA